MIHTCLFIFEIYILWIFGFISYIDQNLNRIKIHNKSARYSEIIAINKTKDKCQHDIFLPSGLPDLKHYDKNLKSQIFLDVEKYAKSWMEMHKLTMNRYAKKWVRDPLHWWSRTYEYSFHIQHIKSKILCQRKNKKQNIVQLLDAGAGTDFISWYLLSLDMKESGVYHNVTAVDFDKMNGLNHAEINARYVSVGMPWSQTVFVRAALQQLPLPSMQYDIVFCISVLEHTDNFHKIISEFYRVLNPGGILIVSFDIDLVEKGPVYPARAYHLLQILQKYFKPFDDVTIPKSLNEFEFELNRPTVVTSDILRKNRFSQSEWSNIHGHWHRSDLTFHCSVWEKEIV